MAKKPILIFPKPGFSSKSKKNGRGPQIHFPSTDHQIENFQDSISNLDRVLKNKTAYLGNDPANLVSEMVLVLETAGTLDDFYKAVSKTPGMAFLVEQQKEIEPNDIFFNLDDKGNRTDSKVGARLFLTMTNRVALVELLKYWREYRKPKDNQNFQRGTTKFRSLFEQLIDIRPYSVEDRLKDTGFDTYLELKQFAGEQEVYFEVELSFKSVMDENNRAFQEVQNLITNAGGYIIPQSLTIIPEIQYHAFIGVAPLHCFDELTENTNVNFLKSQQVLYFRPVGQSIFTKNLDLNIEVVDDFFNLNQREILQDEPVIALLDGLPLQNHSSLVNRLIIDDPDDFSVNYLAENRNHGTAMASLILNGDLNNPNMSPLLRPIYVRPLMTVNGIGDNATESLPHDRLPIDLVHRAVKRMFDGENGIEPVAPNVKIINFSIGDSFRPFNNNISTWAKLIDWLSYKYNVLFIISTGNKVDNLIFNVEPALFDNLSNEDKEKEVLRNIVSSNTDRKILTPAESINSITVGASHSDFSELGNFPQRLNLVINPNFVSPFSRIGFGYNNSVKPEILMPGGRKLFRKDIRQPDREKTILKCEDNIINYTPGHKVAIPGSQGNLNSYGYLTGTSNSAALTTNLAAQIFEMLLKLNLDADIEHRIDPRYFTLIIKSLLVHSASWDASYKTLEEVLKTVPSIGINYKKRHLIPYIGYGVVDSEKILYCTDQRVTLIGYGELSKKEGKNAHIFKFPLPASIAGKKIEKKIAITLAWFSPLNFNSSKYRKAQLFFDNIKENEYLEINRNMYDLRLSQKGTLQHDILYGDKADVFIEGNELIIKVNCREDASGLNTNENIQYAISVTFEIINNIETEIYDEVQLSLRQQIRQRV